eukprot:TRINITY_DN7425_c0_g1_i1.p1 TRINITY_DN7425_c0_g1~~TRINITY_DN7425_c0_g1_i1.p1  ORF type:complete len:147 (-),score=8.89 TRINITY_DN7425_c0_g1_i1:86-526(-)
MNTTSPQTYTKSSPVLSSMIRYLVIYSDTQRTPIYAYDHITMDLINRYFYGDTTEKIDTLPMYMMCTLAIACVHSESLKYQLFSLQIIESIESQYGRTSHAPIIKRLRDIHENHYTRIVLFGRIPERNQYLHRKSTPEERTFMASV